MWCTVFMRGTYDMKTYGVATISRLLNIVFFYRALLQKRPIILRILLIVATSYDTETYDICMNKDQ